jgi:hypothetical protein
MADIRINFDTRDIDVVNGSMSLTESDDEALQQRLFIKLQIFKGEWFMDTEFGVPYYQNVLGQKSSLDAVNAIMVDQILSTDGVASLSHFNVTFDAPTRDYRLNFGVKSTQGSIVEVSI